MDNVSTAFAPENDELNYQSWQILLILNVKLIIKILIKLINLDKSKYDTLVKLAIEELLVIYNMNKDVITAESMFDIIQAQDDNM